MLELVIQFIFFSFIATFILGFFYYDVRKALNPQKPEPKVTLDS